MGNCVQRIQKREPIQAQMPGEMLCNYPRTGSVKVRYRNFLGKITNEQVLNFAVTEPTALSAGLLQIAQSRIFVSMCILPGMDTRNISTKVCQDNAFYMSDGASLFVCLLDGHGIEGEKIVQFCKPVVEDLYATEKEMQQKDPNEFMTLVTLRCDEELIKNSLSINASLSGSTAVFLYITEKCIYSGSVGDSRAVLASSEIPHIYQIPNSVLNDQQLLADVRKRRSSHPEIKIWPVQLTRDQKPNDADEKLRIEASGGRVQRLVDEFGKRIGPFRVWEKTSNCPGLAMSRSIGDLVAKKIGVLNTPICNSYDINKDSDLFIVVASDGLWDVMDNEDVVNFTECFRSKCKTEALFHKGINARLGNSCIAQILAEEARVRWYTIVEEEDAAIDDISCIVIELQTNGNPIVQHAKRPIPDDDSLQMGEGTGDDFHRAPSINEIAIRDPKRSSVVGEANLKVDID